MQRTEFPNLMIVSILLKDFCGPYISTLEEEYLSSENKLEAVRNMASDAGNDEIVAICDYLERNDLVTTFFPE